MAEIKAFGRWSTEGIKVIDLGLVNYITLERLQAKRKKEPLRPKSYLRTHPYTSDRILTIKRESGLPLEFKDIINTANEGYE